MKNLRNYASKFLLSILLCVAVAIAGIESKAQAEEPDAVSHALALCEALEEAGSYPCSISGWNSTIDVIIDTNSSGARSLCVEIVALEAKRTRVFKQEWRLQIFSPYGSRPIAVCKLE
jgi:hypothetical protein